MKIQCDMCAKKEASVYCTADEASLCHACDRRVHHANKLASKHLRFSLHSSADRPPLCDICQFSNEKRAFLFCKEDRAILCKACDISIHGANEHTKYHTRFLLAGVKLSESSSCFDSSSDQALCSSNSNGSSNCRKSKTSIVSKHQNLRVTTDSTSVNDRCEGVSQEDGVSMETSSISEYLMETLPGWQVEEFLNPGDSSGDMGCFWSEDLGHLVNSSSGLATDDQMSGTSSLSQGYFINENVNYEKLQTDQYGFNPSSFKRPRQLW